MSCTTASRRPMIRLTSVDLPTLGRPTTARTGTAPDVALDSTWSLLSVSVLILVPSCESDAPSRPPTRGSARLGAAGYGHGLNEMVDEVVPRGRRRTTYLRRRPRS